MPRNAGKATPRDLINTLAIEEGGVTRVRAVIGDIPEPVDAFRVSSGSTFKAKLEAWRGPNEYTSCLRNLLQRHFKKITGGEWFASGAILVPKAEANSVERTWGRGVRNPHPKWESVEWEVVIVEALSNLPAPPASPQPTHTDQSMPLSEETQTADHMATEQEHGGGTPSEGASATTGTGETGPGRVDGSAKISLPPASTVGSNRGHAAEETRSEGSTSEDHAPETSGAASRSAGAPASDSILTAAASSTAAQTAATALARGEESEQGLTSVLANALEGAGCGVFFREAPRAAGSGGSIASTGAVKGLKRPHEDISRD